MNEKNGHTAPSVPTSEQVAVIDAQLTRVKPIIQSGVQVMIRGLLMSCPGVPPNVIATCIAFEAGHFMGQIFEGDIATIAGIRNSLKTAFQEGVQKAPLIPPRSNWTPPDINPKA